MSRSMVRSFLSGVLGEILDQPSCRRRARAASNGGVPRSASDTTRPCSTHSSRSEEHTSELQSPCNLVCRLLLEKKKKTAKAVHEHAHPRSQHYVHHHPQRLRTPLISPHHS